MTRAEINKVAHRYFKRIKASQVLKTMHYYWMNSEGAVYEAGWGNHESTAMRIVRNAHVKTSDPHDYLQGKGWRRLGICDWHIEVTGFLNSAQRAVLNEWCKGNNRRSFSSDEEDSSEEL